MRIGLVGSLIVTALMVLPLPAAATGGLWCNADDGNLTFAARTGLSDGINGGFLNFAADLQIKLAGVPSDLRSLHFDQAAISQRWLDVKDFKLRLYRERDSGPSAYAVLVVLTTAVSEGAYRGHYELSIFAMKSADDPRGQSWEKQGVVACSAG